MASPQTQPQPPATAKRAARPLVRPITGESFEADVVTQDELERLAQQQECIWLAARSAMKLATLIENRIENGAKVESGRFRVEKFMLIRMRASSKVK